jgi:prepilin-type N-terminal cleavage/methylation domain-containing protein
MRVTLKRQQYRASAEGFTIVELLVATVVFSVVLLVATAGILQIARVYYKGVTESNTQNTARAIIDDISQGIQFSGGAVSNATSGATGSNLYFCIGDTRVSYVQGWQVENNPVTAKNQGWHALVQDTPAGGCNGSTGAQVIRDNQAVNGQDLMGVHMRLSALTVNAVGTNQYSIHVRVAYGDDDLLNGPTTSTAACKGIRAGTQFCSVADLSTVVIKRVE